MKGHKTRVKSKGVTPSTASVPISVLLCVVTAFATVLFFTHNRHDCVGSSPPLRKSVLLNDATELGDVALAIEDSASAEGNPWRNRNRRCRKDLVVAQAGCGGSYRIAASWGDRVRLRYFVREKATIKESTRDRGPVDLVLGRDQVESVVESALIGLCAGEVLRINLGNHNDLIIAVISVIRAADDVEQMRVADDMSDELTSSLVPTAGRRGASCTTTCSRKDMECHKQGFYVLNSCSRLRPVFACTSCEIAAIGTAGADMPCHVAQNAPLGFPRGLCMVHPSVKYASCEASHEHTRRLCPCVPTA